MKRSVGFLGGGVLGLVLGTVFLAQPIASAMFSYATVAWSTDGCPSGSYTLASTAQLFGGGPTYNLNTTVQLPRSEVAQTFSVPAGQYTVSSSLRRSDGSVVGSGVQLVMTTEEGAATTAPRTRTGSQPVTGMAGARQTPPPPAAPSLSAPAPAVTPAVSKTISRTAAPRQSSGYAIPREWLLADLIRLSDPDGFESGWHQVQLLDLNGDGLVDEVQIETPNGTTIVWRLVPQALSRR